MTFVLKIATGTITGLAAVAALLFPSPALARYEEADVFSSPSRSIYCSLLQDRPEGGNGVRCVVPASGRGGRWPYFELHETGLTRRFLSDDYPDRGIVPKIRYGQTWAMAGGTPKVGPISGAINCSSRRTGLTCRNRSGHGFTLSRAHQRRF